MSSLDASAAVLAAPAFDGAFFDDPYPAYGALRAAGPLLWRDDAFQGAWLMTRHEDVERALRDPRLSSRRTAGWVKRVPGGDHALEESQTFQRLFGAAMVFLDAPDHPRLRRAMAAGFHPSLLRGLRPVVERLTLELLDGLDGCTGFDFIGAIARQLPSRVMAELLGVPRCDEARFCAWSDALAAFIGALQATPEQLRAAQRSLLQMMRYFEQLLPQRRLKPGADLVSLLLQAEAAGQIHTDAELVAQCAMLLFAGHETTRNLLGNGLYTLLAHPEQWAALRAAPAGLPLAMREVLRYDSPVQYTGRRVSAEFTLHGQTLRRGELVLLMIGAANRDPARFPDPERFDIGRREGSHLSFGSGPHVCIGAGLALMEAEVVLELLMRRWPDLRLADRAPSWNGNAGLRGLARLPVVTGTRAI